MITPLEIIAVLNEAKISFVLVGMYGLAGWMPEPRATQDVDVIVASKHLKKTIKAFTTAFPNLEYRDEEVVIRFRDKDTQVVVIDVMKPAQPHLGVIFKNTVTIETDKQKYRVPSLEMALALKFAPMVSLARPEEKKYQDAHDFIVIVKNNSEDIDEEKLAQLGDLVHPGGGEELVEMVRKVRAGEQLQL